jgi:tRNA G18 (ribose-2'-O)-methylase SpoU
VREAAASGDAELILLSDAAKVTAPKGVRSVLIKDSLFKKLSQTETSQGIIAVVKKNK